MMEDEVAALVVDNGSGKSESTLKCNKRAVVHFQKQTEIMPMVTVGQISVKIPTSEFRFSGSTILTHFSIF